MIRTKFDARFREIPLDLNTLQLARKKIETDLPIALDVLEAEAGEPSELSQTDYYRLLSRASDLERFELQYAAALVGFERASIFWKSIDWIKAAFLCDLKAALCHSYLVPAEAVEDWFSPLLARIEKDEEALKIYRLFFHQYRGQVFAFHQNYDLAEVDFRLALKLSMDAGKKKQIERFSYFVERVGTV